MNVRNSIGKIGYEAIFFFLALGFVVIFFYPLKYSPTQSSGCAIGEAPGKYEELTNLPAFPLDQAGTRYGTIEVHKRDTSFVLIRKNVLAPKVSEVGRDFFDDFNKVHTEDFIQINSDEEYAHTVNLGESAVKKGYDIFYPTGEANTGNNSAGFFYNQKIIFLVNTDPNTIIMPKASPNKGPIYTVDVYVQKSNYRPNFDYEKAMFGCETGSTLDVGSLYFPDQQRSSDKEQLQLEWFLLKRANVWATHCKPAIYLYPSKKELVNVKVVPDGFLTYTDPSYDREVGWNVEANPDGKLMVADQRIGGLANQFDYLYFESKIHDEVIEKPSHGWVVKSQESRVKSQGEQGTAWFEPLEERFNDILPKLGLNQQQTKDFIDYWKKALHYSPYYFIGVIDQDNVNQFEKLEITPKPDSVNRVRIYFEALDQPKEVSSPEVIAKPFTLNPVDFQVVEWGGMVKNDRDHPFTCSQ